MDFTQFNLDAYNHDETLCVIGDLNGNDGKYTGLNSPVSLTSAPGGCLTFMATSNSIRSAPEWSAIILGLPVIPTLSEWGMIILGLGLFVFSILAIRQKRPSLVK